MRSRFAFLRLPAAAVLTAVLCLGHLSAALPAHARQGYHPAIDESVFPVPRSLWPAIAFWRDIFAKYDDNQIVIHDDRHMDVVYEVVDVSDLVLKGLSDVARARARTERVRDALDRNRLALRYLSGDRRVTPDQATLDRVQAATRGVGSDRAWYRGAQSRVRSQSGLRDEFANAIQISGMFMDGIQKALEEEGLPMEISRLPFVESMFNYKARSKVGASGAWQFTRSTGRLYMRIDSAVDERSDILIAAHGAARYLKANYRRVESWPLALTGYNHGIGGMVRAMRRLGTKDMGVIVDRYRSRSFGFASRNFYAEFVAAVVVYADREELFPGIEPLEPWSYETLKTDAYVSLLDVADIAGIDEGRLAELNPALTRAVVRGDLLVPKDYELRVPEGQLTEALNAYELLPPDRKRSGQLARRHRVSRGETVGQIARRYGTSIRTIQVANNLPRADRIYVGQVLEIPSTGSGTNWQRRLSADRIAAIKNPPPQPEIAPALAHAHFVASGETLSQIADRYGVSVSTLVRHNGLRSPDRLRVGQRINIPGGAERGTATSSPRYTVRAGDTLARIASAHDTTVDAIMRLNGLRSTVIQIGQVLAIP